MAISSQHHSFDISLATQYSIEEAIIIHHFQHWIRINKINGKNQKDGRTWTYQTRRDIAANFPYFTEDQVRRICEKLVNAGVLIQANYNKSAIDRTLWYAFADEAQFQIDDDTIQKMFTKGKSAKWIGKSAKWIGKSATAIPDTITDTKPDPSLKEEEGKPLPPLEIYKKEPVEMPQKSYKSLITKYGHEKIDAIIHQMILYAKIHPKKFQTYKDHAAVAESWVLKELKNGDKSTSWKQEKMQMKPNANVYKANSSGFDTRAQPSQKSLADLLNESQSG